ncbi:MAG: ABC transporter permease [Microbacteriaceae bacterium]
MSQHPALTDPEYKTPGKSRGLLSVFNDPYLMTLIVKKGIKTRYYGSALGWAWSYVRPFAQFCMYWIVFSLFLKVDRDIENFPLYLFSGLIVVNLFGEIFRNTTSAIVDNSSLVKKIFLPRELFPVAAVGVALVHFMPQVVILVIVALFFGLSFSWLQIAAFVAAVLLLVIWTLGLGLFFGAINVKHRDSRNIVDLILMFSTWGSPVIYSWSMVQRAFPDWLFHIYMANPATAAVELFHYAFWAPTATAPDLAPNLLTYSGAALGLGIVALLIGQLVFKKTEGTFAQHL